VSGTQVEPDPRVIRLDDGPAGVPAEAGSAPPDGAADLDRGDLLHRVAMTLNSTLDLRDVLLRLATLALETTGAYRCSLFLLEGTRLHPAVALGERDDVDLWGAFHEMGPVDLTDIPDGLPLMRGLRPVAIEDATNSDLIPRAWAERFALESVVIAPLHAVDELCGIIVLDYPRRSFDAEELRVLEALAAYAGLAVRNARVFESARQRARIQEGLARGGRKLAATADEAATIEVLVDAYMRILGATGCAIGLVDLEQQRITAVATNVAVDGPPSTLPLSVVPAAIVGRLTEAWEQRIGPVEFGPEPWFAGLVGPDLEQHIVLPLLVQEDVRGAVILGFDRARRLNPEELTGIKTLAAMGSTVLERSSLTRRLEDNVRRLEILSGVSAALVDGADAAGLVRRLGGLLGDHGIRVVALSLRDRSLARAMGAEAPMPAERSINAKDPAAVQIGEDLLAVPLLLNNRVVGTLRVRPADLGAEERTFLETVGRGVADVVTRGALRSSVESLALDQAVATVRDVMAGDLHDTLAQYFVAVGLLARSDGERLPPDSRLAADLRRIAELADSGKWEVDQAMRALAYVPGGDRPLSTALTELAASFRQESGIRVLVDVDPVGDAVGEDSARVLYRVAHEALVNSWRHGRASIVRMSVIARDDHIVLEVRDDGVGFGRHSGDRVSGVGLTMIRRLLNGVGGDLKVGNAKPRGALLVATVPAPVP
jgi:signal transduction histidine kinase